MLLGAACYFSWVVSDRLFRRIIITHCNCVIEKFPFTISGPFHFEVNCIFKATELTSINNVIRVSTKKLPNVNGVLNISTKCKRILTTSPKSG